MLTRHLAMALCVSALGGCATLVEPTSEPITKLELRSLRSGPATDLVLDQLSDVLIIDQPSINPARPPQTQLSDAFFYTRPRSTDYSGLCQSDEVVVLFDPVDRSNRGAATRVRAVGVETTHLFHFLPSATTPLEPQTENPVQNSACAQLDPRGDFFMADEARSVHSAIELLTLIRQHLNDRPASFEITCAFPNDCPRALSEWDAARIRHVARCFNPGGSGECITVDDDNYGITIEARQVWREGEGSHWEVSRVRVDEVITVADPRID